MGDGFQYLDIVVFAVIAGFLILRLRGVLGRRTGNERRRDPIPTPKPGTAPEKVASIPSRNRPAGIAPSGAAAVASALAALKAADPGFDEKSFLAGARGAFEIIVNAFAKGDTAALQPLLNEAVYASFSGAISARQVQRETLQTTLLTIKATETAAAELEGDTAFVTVRFVSDQINVTRAADGTVIDGDPDRVVEKTDLWTFSRSLRSRDPNWTLVATSSP
ncbi:MAG TPA: Tim44/TimA family putative adaptor protein [Stellaceae bacterium]